jgi:PAP2 superfamily
MRIVDILPTLGVCAVVLVSGAYSQHWDDSENPRFCGIADVQDRQFETIGVTQVGQSSLQEQELVEPIDLGSKLDAAVEIPVVWNSLRSKNSPQPLSPLPKLAEEVTLDSHAIDLQDESDEPWLNCSAWNRSAWNCCANSKLLSDVCTDYGNYYSWRTLRDFGIVFGGAAVLANTRLDQDFRNSVQDNWRNSETDNFANFWKTFGEGHIFAPSYAILAGAGYLVKDFDMPLMHIAGEFGYRATRAYLVGTPPLLMMQIATGGSRPGEKNHNSTWVPFADDNGISGHAFIGSVPFITAAQMVDSRLLKAGFYMMSTFTAWSRINDDDHYLSQVCLGWYMGYQACRSVNETETGEQKPFRLLPMLGRDTLGASMVFDW